jgi:hypothetical protein
LFAVFAFMTPPSQELEPPAITDSSFRIAICLGQANIHHQTRCGSHQDVAHEAGPLFLARLLAIEACFRISVGGVRLVRTLLAVEIQLGVAARRWQFGGWRAVVTTRIAAGLGWSFSSRPRLGSMPVYGEMLVRKQRRHRLVRQNRRQELAGDVGGQQSVAVSAEYGRHLHRIVYAEPYKPAKQQIVLLVRSAHLRHHDDRRR